jgi:starch phosphorylase
MVKAWPIVAVMRLTCDEGDLPVGRAMSVRAEVRLGFLEPDDVVVEAVHGEVDSRDALRSTECVPLTLIERRDGVVVFGGEVPCQSTGRRGLSVRVRPTPRLNPQNPFEANLLTWWEGGLRD